MARHSKSFLIIGIGRFGASVARTLVSLGQEVLCVDNDEERISSIAEEVTHAIVADATEERVLDQLGVSNFDAIVIAVSDDLHASILTAVLCRERGAKKIIAKAHDPLHAKLLIKVGVDTTILPERDSGRRVAHALSHDSVLDYIELSDRYSISELLLPPAWTNKTLRELNVRAKYKATIMAVKRGEELMLMLDSNLKLLTGDVLVMLGDNEDLRKVEDLWVSKTTFR